MSFEAFFKISYGLYIISAGSKEKMNGYVANTAFQVTSEPAQIAISCSKNNFTTSIIQDSGSFSISILKKDAKPNTFGPFGYKSGKEIDKFASVNYKIGALGTPILLDDTLAWFECKLVNTVDVGTHLLFIGEIVDYKLIDAEAEPLTYSYFREVKKGKAPKNAPTYIDPSKTTIQNQ